MSNESAPKANRTNRRTLILLVILMAAPIIASYTLYFWEVKPESINYGELLEVKPLAGDGLNQSNNTIFRMRDLRGKWALISVDSGKCDEYCRKKLYYMRQVRLIQNTEKNRIERVWLIDDPEIPAPEIASEFEGTWLVNAKNSEILTQIPAKASRHDHIYLIDPIGNLMMRFPKNPDPALMAKDIKRLLKVSQLEHAMGTDSKH
ncbi:membrane protein [Nitrosospira sp. NpAV]|nr:membrane protein [Nitrosospira sp. NpAV]